MIALKNELKISNESSGFIKGNFFVNASFAVFITYLCMYAFRKPFTAATFEDKQFMGVDYKIALIILQLIGYTVSKFIGIKIISELKSSNRLIILMALLFFALISLFLFAITPYPFNAIFMFINGLPLGMIWGVVFGFIEGRKSTELLGAIMASSFIVSSGLVKSTGRLVLDIFNTSESWMPFVTAIIYIPILLLGILLLRRIPAPSDQDQLLRTSRVPMSGRDRLIFIKLFAPGIIFSILIYVALTIFRDIRDNFAVEFWNSMGFMQTPVLLAFSEIPIALTVMTIISSMILIKNNKIAFYSIFYITITSGLLLILATLLFYNGQLNGILWMILAGFAMYLPYIGYHTLFFERWIAHFKYESNTGFLMSMADTAGYFGSTILLLFKNFATPNISWVIFFEVTGIVTGILLLLLTVLNFYSFKHIEKNLINN